MKNATNMWALVLVIITFFPFAPVLAGETKNNIIFDCNKPGDDDLTCLACNIYHEARSESSPGLWLVALATKNRVDGNLYPLTKAGPKVQKDGFTSEFCKVVYEQRYDKKRKRWVPMFSWTLDGKHDRVYNKEQWAYVNAVAERIVKAYNGEMDVIDITFGCQWYHRHDISPYWMKAYHPTVRIGAHQCYSLNEEVYLQYLNVLVPNVDVIRVASDS